MGMSIEKVRDTYRTHVPGPIGKHRIFSVLVPFVEKEDGLYLLYEQRSRTMKTQPGETCFPGGHLEEGETPLETALRETEEEIGIPRGRIELAGEGDILHGFSNFTLYTFIGIIAEEDLKRIQLEKDEVDEVFLVKVDDFITYPPEEHLEQTRPIIPNDFPYDKIGIGRDYPWRMGKAPIFIYEIQDKIIWGMTARITRNVLATLAESNPEFAFDEKARKAPWK